MLYQKICLELAMDTSLCDGNSLGLKRIKNLKLKKVIWEEQNRKIKFICYLS